MIVTVNSKRYLGDVCVIRIILIFLLIIYHALCPYTTGFWSNPQDYDIPTYFWIGKLTYSFMLETFVLISGLILGYQVLTKGEAVLSFTRIVKSKIKRLILPSIIFSVIYYALFMNFDGFSIQFIFEILNGTGHMWFLPMLFWCFVGIYILTRFRYKEKYILPALILLAVSAVINLPFGLKATAYYFFFFFLGYSIGLKRIDFERFATMRFIVVCAILFAVTFSIFGYLRYKVSEALIVYLIDKYLGIKINIIVVFMIQNFWQLIYSTIGTILIYLVINYMISTGRITVTNRIVKLSAYCFGVYICQEFILKIFYYKLGFISTLNPYVFPWVGIAITIVLSLLITHYALKTRLGRFLLA